MKIKSIAVSTKKGTRKTCVDEAKLLENFGIEHGLICHLTGGAHSFADDPGDERKYCTANENATHDKNDCYFTQSFLIHGAYLLCCFS